MTKKTNSNNQQITTLTNVLVGDKQRVRWPKKEHEEFKDWIAHNLGYKSCAALFEGVPKYFFRTLMNIYASGISSPGNYKLITDKMRELKEQEEAA